MLWVCRPVFSGGFSLGWQRNGCPFVYICVALGLRCSVADDGICPKANAVPLRGLTVRNTTVRSRSGAIKFGSNTGPGTTLLPAAYCC